MAARFSVVKQQACVIAPVLCGAGAPSSSPLSRGHARKGEGAERRKARPLQSVPRTLPCAGASRRSTRLRPYGLRRALLAASCRRRAALLGEALQRAFGFPRRPAGLSPSASSSRRVVVPASGAPAPPGWREERSSPTPRAPHPAPSSRRLLMTPSDEQDLCRNIFKAGVCQAVREIFRGRAQLPHGRTPHPGRARIRSARPTFSLKGRRK